MGPSAAPPAPACGGERRGCAVRRRPGLIVGETLASPLFNGLVRESGPKRLCRSRQLFSGGEGTGARGKRGREWSCTGGGLAG